jgi:hypothetical protein
MESHWVLPETRADRIKCSLPLDVPNQPAFDRQIFKHEIKTLAENICYDDIYHLNTQSGTQWDGFRHVTSPSTTPSPMSSNLPLVRTHPIRLLLQRRMSTVPSLLPTPNHFPDKRLRHNRSHRQSKMLYPPLVHARYSRPWLPS